MSSLGYGGLSSGLGGYGGGMYGGMGGGMYGGGYGGYGSGMGMMGRRGMMGPMNTHLNEPLPQAPGVPQQAGSSGAAAPLMAPPPENETPRQRKHRLRHERRMIDRQCEERRMQRRTFYVNAASEMISHALQIFVHLLRTGCELLSISFGMFYSYVAMRSFLTNAQRGGTAAGMMAEYQRALPSPNGPSVSSSATPGGVGALTKASGTNQGMGRMQKVGVLVVIVAVAELLYSYVTRRSSPSGRWQATQPGGTSEPGALSGDDEDLETDDDESESDEELASDAVRVSRRSLTSSGQEMLQDGVREGRDVGNKRGLFIALHDHAPPASLRQIGPDGVEEQDPHLAFQAGDQLLIDDYLPDQWCFATLVDANGQVTGSGFVPGNYVRPLTLPQKM